MYCTRCAQPNADGTRFCTRCGAALTAAQAPAHAVPQARPHVPAPPMQPVARPQAISQAAPTAPNAQQPKPAGFFRRFFALCVDTIILILVVIVTAWLLGWLHEEFLSRTILDPEGRIFARLHARFRLAGMANVLFTPLLYFVLLDWMLQGTLGKCLLGCRVADLSGKRVGPIRAALRTLLKPLSAAPLLIGFLLAAFTSRKQALHDLLTGSVVLKRR